MSDLTITLPDGSSRILPEGSTGLDIAAPIGPGLAKAAVIVSVDGEGRDLNRALADGDSVSVVTADSYEGLYTLRHSTAHVLAQAVLDLWPGAPHAIGPPLAHGFSYDFELPGGAVFSFFGRVHGFVMFLHTPVPREAPDPVFQKTQNVHSCFYDLDLAVD